MTLADIAGTNLFILWDWNQFPPCAMSRLAVGALVVDELVAILVVEDDELIQSVVEEALADGGFEVNVASSGEQAVQLLNAANKYRALVTDIGLGRDKMDGWAVARHVRENKPDIPVIYMSGESAEDWASQGVPNSLMLSKPFAPAQLVTAVSQLLNGAPQTS